MTKINKLGMAHAISQGNDITISKTCFGLCEKAVYNTTGSPVRAHIFEYSPSNGESLAALLDSKTEEIERHINRGVSISHTPVGNIRMEICVSDDRQFLAVNILRFSNFRYESMGCVRFFRGKDAELASRLFEL